MQSLSTLNSAQQAAVTHPQGPALVLAGAGSGKTRVLTHRMAYLIDQKQVAPTQILAVTFTNKAAAEMRGRVFQSLNNHSVMEHQLWVSTFHSACVKILRSEIGVLGYNPHFTIYDDSDQLSVIRAVMKALNISQQMISPKAIQSRINRLKNDGYDVTNFPSQNSHTEELFAQAFALYTKELELSSALDFGDLILLTLKIFKTQPKIREAYRNQFRHILIDEYQDTNRCQYELIKILTSEEKNIFAVGDEDQSIYKWRGADIKNILNFEKDYPEAKIYKLEQNYRSTQKIITAASKVISHNFQRREKTLWTDNPQGESLYLHECYDEHDEAKKAIKGIEEQRNVGVPLTDIAIIYRTNAQSRVLEDQLRAHQIPYRIFGGLRFYDRLEIKDALAYMRLIQNQNDDASLRRIINVPARGIGSTSIEKMNAKAREHGMSLFQVIAHYCENDIKWELGRNQKKVQPFCEMMKKLIQKSQDKLPSDCLTLILEETGYQEALLKESTTEAESRLENLNELKQSIVEYELRVGAQNPEQEISLAHFLEQITLVSEERQQEHGPTVSLMTIHMAKGLEFPIVLMVGLEEELFPSVRSWEHENPDKIEEERRLFYVGMTRAEKQLNLFYAKNRTVFGHSGFRVRSRFVDEIPIELTNIEKTDHFDRRDTRRHHSILSDTMGDAFEPPPESDFEFSQESSYSDEIYDETAATYRPGQKVRHPLWGEGLIKKVEEQKKLWIFFPQRGLKKISLDFTDIQLL